jgi:drug/metabolite transporter (DMT)-like permease
MRLFDLRLIIAFLFGLYGVVLVVIGVGFTSDDDLKKAEGVNINLWAGVAMVVLAAVFAAWATLRPQFAKTAQETATTGDDLGKQG